ncbi:MAG: hypothetical protein ABIQ16_04915 [Polyangiaceae bacterium]
MRALAWGALLATLLGLGHARACSCSGQGPASALTRPDQTWGVRLSERLLLGYGAFNAHGEYAAFAPSEHDRTVEYGLLGAYRWQRLELSGSFSYGLRSAAISDQAERSVGFGDTTLRARYEAANEPEPWQTGVYPGLAVLGSVRLPTASAAGLAPRGLGTSEFALGVVLERALSRTFRAGLVAEVAGRLPDTSLGITRRLGPRASVEFTLSYFATPDWVVSALLGLRWEGNASLRQREQSGTAQRTTELGAAVSWQPWSSPFRAGLVERYAPAVDQLGANTVRSATSELWLGFVR